MADSDESLLQAIYHYQSGLERYLQRQDEAKMLHNLGRLLTLPIKVYHLEKTGVGRTVNSLRKCDGEVGEKARALVARWKEMVVQEEEKQLDSSSPGPSPPKIRRIQGPTEDIDQASTSQNETIRENISQSTDEKQSTSHINTVNDIKDGSDKHSKKSSSSEKKHEYSKSRTHRENNSKKSTSKEHNKRPHSSSETSNEDNDSKNSYSDSSDDNIKRIKLDKEKKNHENEKSSHKSTKDSKNKSKNCSEEDENDHELRKSKSKKHEKHETNEKKKHKHKSSTHEKKDERSKSVDKNKSKEEKKHDSSKHEKEKRKEHKDREPKEEKVDKPKKSKHSDKSKKDKYPTQSDNQSSKSEASCSSKKEKKNDKSKNPKPTSYSAVVNGIGSESGTSFADALGMCAPPPSKKKKFMPQPERPRAPSPVPHEREHSPELPLPKEPLENLDINISTLLPSITPHYRPLGLPVDDQSKRLLTDDEALSRVMMNKNQRTKVFSGNKVAFGKVPSLFDICVRILQDNLDALEYTGGVPYSILKPILEKATANQLYMMEHHNPYLIEDSDELWHLHCQKEFRNKSREELETWRDMYMRCLDEREAKLKALTANIKQAQDKSLPVRTTKLAYVDSVAKPPRNIARKQAKNDTSSVRPSASTKLAALATKGEASKVVVPNPGARAAERSSGSSHSLKVKKAPLMAKTLSLFKNRFRR